MKYGQFDPFKVFADIIIYGGAILLGLGALIMMFN